MSKQDEFKQSAKHTQNSPRIHDEGPVSHVQIDQLLKQLTKPQLVSEHTPTGPVHKEVLSEQNRKLTNEIERQQTRLEERHGDAKVEFEKAQAEARRPKQAFKRSI